MAVRVASACARGRGGGQLAEALMSNARQKLQADPNVLLWLGQVHQPQSVAIMLSSQSNVCIGAATCGGLIGGGQEWKGAIQSNSAGSSIDADALEESIIALALRLPEGANAMPFYSQPHGLPELPDGAWANFARATPETTPHMLMLAAAPSKSAFPIEPWLHRMDVALPWANKVGGIVAGDERLFVGGDEYDGGVAGIAFTGVTMDSVVCQGTEAVGPAFTITSTSGSEITSLNDMDVHSALGEYFEQAARSSREHGDKADDGDDASSGVLMAGISVPALPTASTTVVSSAHAAQGTTDFVVRQLVGYLPLESRLAIGAAPELLQSPGARFQLQRFSAPAARAELRRRALEYSAQHGAVSGGMHVSCVGRGENLYGSAGVESEILREAFGAEVPFSGFFANGEFGRVGWRTFAHTFTSSLAIFR